MASARPRKGSLIGKEEVRRAIDLRADGNTWREVGEKIGRPGNSIRNAVITSAPEEHEEALERWRDSIRTERRVRAFDRQDKWSAKFLDDLSQEQLPEVREARKSVNAPSPEDERTDRIAEALERFTVAVLSRATTGPAALTPGGTE